jgi:hypothetical protein
MLNKQNIQVVKMDGTLEHATPNSCDITKTGRANLNHSKVKMNSSDYESFLAGYSSEFDNASLSYFPFLSNTSYSLHIHNNFNNSFFDIDKISKLGKFSDRLITLGKLFHENFLEQCIFIIKFFAVVHFLSLIFVRLLSVCMPMSVKSMDVVVQEDAVL